MQETEQLRQRIFDKYRLSKMGFSGTAYRKKEALKEKV